MNKKRGGKRRLPARVKQPLVQQERASNSWSMDFMSDSLMGIRKFRIYNLIDDCRRGVLAIEIDISQSAERIFRTLERITAHRGKPKTIRTDNGQEFTSKDFELWCKDQNIENQHTQPGKPIQDGYIERFNRLYREAILDAYVFMDLEEVRYLTRE